MGVSVTVETKQATWGCGWHLPRLGVLPDRINGVDTVQTVSPGRVDLIWVHPARVKMHFCQGWALNNTWSSTANGSGNHYNVNLNNGNVNWNNDTNHNYVSCVR